MVRIRPRNQTNRRLWSIVLLALLFFIFPDKAYAYLEPGSTSFVLQLIISVLVGVAIAIKTYWTRTKTVFAYLLRIIRRIGSHSGVNSIDRIQEEQHKYDD